MLLWPPSSRLSWSTSLRRFGSSPRSIMSEELLHFQEVSELDDWWRSNPYIHIASISGHTYLSRPCPQGFWWTKAQGCEENLPWTVHSHGICVIGCNNLKWPKAAEGGIGQLTKFLRQEFPVLFLHCVSQKPLLHFVLYSCDGLFAADCYTTYIIT